MDRSYIQSQRVVERYLSGELSVREARDFEKYCLENPDILESLPIPVRVKAKMQRKPGAEFADGEFDPTATDTSISAAGLDDYDADDADDDRPSRGGYRGSAGSGIWSIVFGVAFLVAAAAAGTFYWRLGNLEKKVQTTQSTAKSEQLQPPTSIQELRAVPSGSQAHAPTLNVGWLTPPQLLDLHFNVAEIKYNYFTITIDGESNGRAIQMRRIAPDTNKELRVVLNSSAFGPGNYTLKFEGHNWRGNTVEVGWVKLALR